jgi:hypothetical protein
MSNIISGHISGQYGGPVACDNFFAYLGASGCVSATADCGRTVVVGQTGINSSFNVYDTIYPDSFTLFEGTSYTGPLGCTTYNGCAFANCTTALTYTPVTFFVNPGRCVEISFIVYSRAYTDSTLFCQSRISLSVSGASAPNTGVLSGEWYPATEANSFSCCEQVTNLCSPTGGTGLYSAFLTYKMFYDDLISYTSNLSSFCCPGYEDCAEGTKSVDPVYAYGSTCVEYYERYCYYTNTESCLGGTGPANHTVASDIAGPKYASYFYCADQPCGAQITITPPLDGSILGEAYAIQDSLVLVSVTGSPGCGTGCAEP